MKDAGQRLGQERLPGSGRSDHQDVTLLKIDVFEPFPVQNPFIVIVDRDGEDFLGAILPDHVVIERRLDVGRLGNDERQR